MIIWLTNWVNQIIIAVIIAVVFELILPGGNNKKYIKMMINFYVLFVILNPVISKLTHQNINSLKKFDYSQYFSNTTQISSNIDFDTVTQKTYEKSLKQDITNKLETKGYKILDLSIAINKNKKDENYGGIQKIIISVQNVKTTNKENKMLQAMSMNAIEINTVEIGIADAPSTKETNRKGCSPNDKKTIKEILYEEYQITEDKIEIN